MKKVFQTLSLMLALVLLGGAKLTAQEAYAVYTSANTTLTFYYDSNRSTHESNQNEAVYDLNTGNDKPAWYTDGTYANVSNVNFPGSFASARPTTTSYWFYHMSNLTSVSNLHNLNTSSVTSMNQMFAYCSGLTNLDLSNFDTGKVTTMQSMFWDCTGLTSINMCYFNTEKVTTMYGMFRGCSALTTLDIRSFKTPALAEIQEMFYGCSNLTTVYAGAGWAYGGTDNQVFNGSTKLVGGEGTTYNSNHLDASYARVDGGTSNPGYFTRVPYAVWDSTAKSLTFYDDGLASQKTGVIYNLNIPGKLPEWRWTTSGGYTSMKSVVFDPSFASARPTSTNAWFSQMTALTSIQGIEYLNTSEVTNMSGMFHGVGQITSIDLSHFNTDKVTSMAQMFQECTELTEIDLSKFNTANVTAMNQMFDGCTGLTELDLSKFNTAKVTSMGYMFRNCTGLTGLDLSTFNTAKVTSMYSMFNGCSNLDHIIVKSSNWKTTGVTAANSVDMFTGCTNLVGGAGTTYDASHVDKTYARIDNGPSSTTPGYLTGQPEEYAIVKDNVCTHYYDGFRLRRLAETGGYDYEGQAYGDEQAWDGENFDKVIFDPSFANSGISIDQVSVSISGMSNLTSIEGLEYSNSQYSTDLSYLFRNCTGLTTLDLSSFDTRNVTDMREMFKGCTSLKTIYVGENWSVAGVTNSTNMFTGCTNIVGEAGTTYSASHTDKSYARIDGGTATPGYLTNITGPYAVYTPSNTTLTFYCDGQRFSREGNVYKLESGTNAPGWYVDNTCASVTKVVFDSSFEDARPISTCCWFADMQALTSFSNLSYLNTSEVRIMSQMFFNTRLTTINLNYFDTHNVTDMSSMFRSCINLTNLDLSSFDTHNVTNTSYMFNYCPDLTTIYVGENWSVAGVTDSENMFKNCTSLKGMNSTTCDGTNNIDKTYARVDGLDGHPGYLSYKPYAVYDSSTKTLTFYCDGKRSEKTGVTYNLNTGIEETEWYSNRSNVTKVVFDSSFAVARPSTTHGWFKYHAKITSFEGFEYLNTSEVTDMGSMFVNCVLQETFDLRNFDTRNVTDMQLMFQGCTGLTTLDLSTFDTQSLANMDYMFYDCTNLTTIYVGDKWNAETVRSGSVMFYNCSNLKGGAGTAYNASHYNKDYAHIDGGTSNPGYLTAVTKPYAVYDSSTTTLTFYYDGGWYSSTGTVYDLNDGGNIPAWISDNGTKPNVTTVVFDASFADARPTSTNKWFSNMKKLTTINGMEYLNTSCVTNMGEMFVFCEKLTSIDLSHFDTHNVEDLGYMFHSCKVLKSLDLSSFDTQLVTDTRYMFYNCSALTTIYVSDDWDVSQAHSSGNMFEGCAKLKGGSGTPYDANHVDKTYAIIDGTNGLPGYFSYKPYVVYNSSTTTLTFRCDGNHLNHTAETEIVYDLNTGSNVPAWLIDDTNASVTKVVFDCSFVLVQPTSVYRWFSGMVKLTTIEGMQYLYTGNATSMFYLFYDCKKLTTLDLSSWNTSKVTSMRSMFNGCTNLKTIYVSDSWSTAAVENSESMFYRCTSLVGQNGTTYDANNIEAGYAIADGLGGRPGYLSYKPYVVYDDNTKTLTFRCDGSQSTHTAGSETVYDLPSADDGVPGYTIKGFTKAVFDPTFKNARPTSTKNWFIGCNSLTEIEGLEYLNTSEVTNMNCMFAGCTSLTSLDLSSWDTGKVTNMGEMFNICRSLQTIYVGDGWSIAALTPENQTMFNGCSSLTGGAGTSYATAGITVATYAHIDGGTSNPGYFTKAMEMYVIYNGSNHTLTFYYDNLIDTRDEGQVYSINPNDPATNSPMWFSEVFNQSIDVQKVVFNGSFVEARPTSTKDWFSGMSNLTQITGLQYLNTSEVTNMNCMFSSCSALQTLDLSHFDTRNVTDMCSMFSGCQALQTLDLSHFNTANVKIFNSMFFGCLSLTSVDVSSFTMDSMEQMGWMFAMCSNLTTIYASGDWSSANGGTSNDMFNNSTKLVGGKGTVWSDANPTDKTYARIDGGTANPGYFTAKAAYKKGDVNKDGAVNVSDVTMLVSMILGNTAQNEMADVNADNAVNVSDVTALVSIILGN
ncbi:MAG: BspA family leucine-rich repeat surface protein [Bacteroidaceae bacterium]|nr:BspA family leucine-rich repeat surface protein [Bacteroidaceae bacterium]